mgnify:CR=1 FL=1
MDYFFTKEKAISSNQISNLVKVLEHYLKTRKPNDELLPNLQYGFDYKMIEKNFRPILYDMIGEHNVTGCFLQRSIVPLNIHSDWENNPDEDTPGYAVLFPLQLDGDAHTIVFKETSHDKHPNDSNKITNYKFSNEDLKLLGHVPEFRLQRVSEPKKIKWVLGDAIVWKRAHFHCSDNFLTGDTKYKDSLVLFTTK